MPRKLSPREIQVLSLAASGKTAKQTAFTLDISESAVNLYIARCELKLKAKSKTEAVAIAIRKGIIT